MNISNNKVIVISSVEKCDFSIKSIVDFFGGYLYLVSHTRYVLYFTVISKEPLSQEQVFEEIVKSKPNDGLFFSIQYNKAFFVLNQE